MKGKKCFGLFLALFIMLGVSLGVSSGDSSALQHEYLTVPVSHRTIIFNNTSFTPSLGFQITWFGSYITEVNAPTPKRQQILIAKSGSGGCVFDRNYWSPTQNYGYSSDPVWGFTSYYGTSTNNLTSICNTLYPFDSSLPSLFFPNSPSVPSFSADSIPITVNPDLAYQYRLIRHNLPYRYSYDHIYLKDKSTSSSGIVYNTSLKASDLYEDGFIPNKFGYLEIPFDEWNDSIGGSLSLGRQIEFTGVFNFPGVTTESGFSFGQNFISSGYFRIYYSAFNLTTATAKSGNIPCEITRTYYALEEDSPGMQLSYSCSTILDFDFTDYLFFPSLQIHAATSDYVWDTTSDWRWSGAYVVTDGDNTPGSVISDNCQGNNCDEAPGSASSLANGEGEADWFDSLVNLFNFNFINPFAPLFEMFTDNSECASIPTIAGMLNSEDDEYCPWFDSSTRSVLTPVLSIASIMLLFGFLVRWLSSSSGNMFEDQTTHKWGNTQFKQKGGN